METIYVSFLCVELQEYFLDYALSTFNQDGGEETTNKCRLLGELYLYHFE